MGRAKTSGYGGMHMLVANEHASTKSGRVHYLLTGAFLPAGTWQEKAVCSEERRACSKSAMAAMAVASEAMDCSMRAWLVLPIALPSAAAAALAACHAAQAFQPWTVPSVSGTLNASLALDYAMHVMRCSHAAWQRRLPIAALPAFRFTSGSSEVEHACLTLHMSTENAGSQGFKG